MNFLKELLLTAWAPFMVLISWVNAFDVPERAKTLDLKIGFDLTADSNGVPSLKIRNFEENRRAYRLEPKPSERADSLDSDEKVKHNLKKQVIKPGIGSEDDDSSSEYRENIRSTKGLRGEYEPEDIPRHHSVASEDSDDNSE